MSWRNTAYRKCGAGDRGGEASGIGVGQDANVLCVVQLRGIVVSLKLIASLETVCDVLIVYVPMPPVVPVSWFVIVVPAVTPVPVMVSPGTIVPDETPLTVSVVPEIEPVSEPNDIVMRPVPGLSMTNST